MNNDPIDWEDVERKESRFKDKCNETIGIIKEIEKYLDFNGENSNFSRDASQYALEETYARMAKIYIKLEEIRELGNFLLKDYGFRISDYL